VLARLLKALPEGGVLVQMPDNTSEPALGVAKGVKFAFSLNTLGLSPMF
jgi:trans-aconitate methyltransferase